MLKNSTFRSLTSLTHLGAAAAAGVATVLAMTPAHASTLTAETGTSTRTTITAAATHVPASARSAAVTKSIANRRTTASRTTAKSASTFDVGDTKPDATNTGPAAIGITTFTTTGDVATTADGQTITGKNINGYVRVKNNNTTVRGNLIHGRNPGSYVQSALVLVSAGVTGTVVDFNEISQDANIGYWLNGVSGSNFTARNNNVHDVTDMFDIDAGGATIEANYVHAFSFHSDDADHASDKVHPRWSHNDGVQVKGGANNTIRGNNIEMYASKTTGTLDAPTAYNYGAGITGSPDKSAITSLVVTKNWLSGGEVGFQSNGFYGGATSANLGTISSNRVSHDQHYYPIRYRAGMTVAGATTNIWDPDHASVPANLAGQPLSTAKGGGIQIDS